MLRLMVLGCLGCPAAVMAGISAQSSSVTLSDDGTTLLVMISPDRESDHRPTAVLPDNRVVELRATFSKSGAYDALTLAPRWQVDWYSRQYDLLCSHDATHVVRVNKEGYSNGWALEFYDRGRLVCRYNRPQLLTGLASPVFMRYDGPWYGSAELTADGSRVRMFTPRRQLFVGGWEVDLGLREIYTFDVSTGAMVSRRVVGRWVVWGYAAVPLAIVTAVAVLMRWRRRCKDSISARGFAVSGKR